ncbi:MAG: zf-HC2 domain-containing protein [Desulfobacteraceae bacterium]|nr:zf-HC2 domain-containing protein [Desulfobacteraceae bacterium]
MIKHWVFNCKDVSSLISRSLDKKLPLSTRLGIKFHLMMCKLCRRYEKQLLIIHAALKEEIIVPLPKSIQEKIKAALKKK